MTRRPGFRSAATLAAAALTWLALPASSQQLFIYPKNGQSQAQQEKDKGACYAWAVQQTGFDPANPGATVPASSAGAPRSSAVRGAARGAAVGAVGGAIGGNAGKGAAIGAAAGGLMGGMRRRDEMQERYAEQSAAEQRQAAARANYNRAFAACLEARGYTVQ
jgi:hypothetical protein